MVASCDVGERLGLGWIPVDRRGSGWVDYFGSESGQVAATRRYSPSPVRPDDYPPDLPFIPGLDSVLVELPDEGRRVLTWVAEGEERDLAHRVEAGARALGWEARGSTSLFFGILGHRLNYASDHATLVISSRRSPGRVWCRLVVGNGERQAHHCVVGIRTM